MRGFLIVNPRSGDDGPGELVRAAAERGIATHLLAPGEDVSEVARSGIDGADALGIAGGDGSLAAVAAVALDHGTPFVCVPFGTRNHFARDLGLDRDDPVAALEAFSAGYERTIDVGRIGGRLFLNNVSLGVYAGLVHRRERHRRRREALARLRALGAVVRHRHPLTLSLDGERIRSRVLLVSNNAYELSLLSLGERERLDEGRLHVYTTTSVLRSAWEEQAFVSLTLDAETHRVRAAVDGEPELLELPVELRIEPRALRVLLPRPDDEEDPVENPAPTETEEELAQTERQEDEEDMRGTTDPREQDDG